MSKDIKNSINKYANVIRKVFVNIIIFSLMFFVCLIISIDASAAAINGHEVTNLDVQNTNGTWSASNAYISGSATGSSGCSGSAVTSTLTMKNNYSSSATLSFDFSISVGSGCYVTIDGTKYSSATSNSYSKELGAGGSIEITVYGAKGATASLELSNIKLFVPTYIDTTFAVSSNGSYTVDGVKITANTTKNQLSTTPYQLVATPNSGYKFLCWKSSNGSILGTTASFSLNSTEVQTIYAIFTLSSRAVFKVGSNVFDDLNEANTAANGSTKKISVVDSGSLSSGNYSISSGVTLLIPMDSSDTVKTSTPSFSENFTDPTLFRSLTLESGVNITVNGSICVMSSVSSKGTGTGSHTGAPYGPYGCIIMNQNSTITLNNNSNLYCWGFIYGAGTILAKSGATVYECFQVRDWCGGSRAYAVNGDSRKIFPFNQYYVQSIESEIRFNYGAIEYAFYCYQSYDASICIINKGTNTALFSMNSSDSYVIKKYDKSTDRLNIQIYGSDCYVSSISLDVVISVSSSNYVLPINSNMTISILSGSKLTISQELSLFPGAIINVEQNAQLVLKKKIVLYDSDDWGTYVFGGTKLTQVYYVPSTSNKKPVTRTITSSDDATICVDGKVIVDSSGELCTSSHGANIYSSNSKGEITFNKVSSGGTVYLLNTISGSSFSSSISTTYDTPYTNAQLKNSDGTYTQTAGTATGTTYYACDKCGAWDTDKNRYTVVFEKSGGSGSNINSVTVCSNKVQLPTSFYTKTGHTQQGWLLPDGKTTSVYNIQGKANIIQITYSNNQAVAYIQVKSITSAYSNGDQITLKAYFEPNKYQINFNPNGGSTPSPSSKEVTYDATFGTLATTSRLGYDFVGWYTSASGGTLITAETSVNVDYLSVNSNGEIVATTLYAHWTGKHVTITYNAMGGTVSPATIDVVYDSPYGTLATPSRTGYNFVGWYNSNTYDTQITSTTVVKVVEDTQIYAKWSAIVYTITLNGNGGTLGSTTSFSVAYDSTTVTYSGSLSNPTRTGYNFVNWKENQGGTGNPVVNVNGGLIPNSSYTDSEGKWVHAGNVTLYASWDGIIYTITLEGNNGILNTGSTTVKFGESSLISTIINPTRTGYTFNSWKNNTTTGTDVISSAGALVASSAYTDSNGKWNYAGDVTLYANWIAKTYTYTLNGNGGTLSVNTATFTFDSNVISVVPQSYPYIYGFTFTGFYTESSSGTRIIDGNYELVANVATYTDSNRNWKNDNTPITLYAHYEATRFILAFRGNNATNGSTSNMELQYNSGATLNANGYNRTGYTYKGWSTTSGQNTKQYDNEQVLTSTQVNALFALSLENTDGIAELFAVWDANTYTITLQDNKNNTTGSVTIKYDSKVFTGSFGTHTVTGYIFNSWNNYENNGNVIILNNQLVANVAGYSDSNGNWVRASDVTLYATYNAKTYNVTLVNTNATTQGSESVTVTYDSSNLSVLVAPERIGYDFMGWKTSNSDLLISNSFVMQPNVSVNSTYDYTDSNGRWKYDYDGTITLYVYWTPKTYLVMFEAPLGTLHTESVTATYDSNSLVPATITIPERIGYNFDGWKTSEDGVKVIDVDNHLIANVDGYTGENGIWKYSDTNVVYLYAEWVAKSYIITLTNTGASSITTTRLKVTYDSDVVLDYDTNLDAVAPEHETLGFGGYVDNNDVIIVNYHFGLEKNTDYTTNWKWTHDGDVTLTVNWVLIYHITYELNGGHFEHPVYTYTVVTEDFILEQPTKEGYQFIGYTGTNLNNNRSKTVKIVKGSTGDRSYTAQWANNVYYVAFDANSGNGSMNREKYEYDKSQALYTHQFEKEGYSFDGWYSYILTTDSNFASGKEYYVLNNNSFGLANVTVGEAVPSNTYYEKKTFTDNQVVLNLTKIVYYEVVMYAKWSAISYEVTLDKNDGTSATTTSIYYDSNTFSPAISSPTRTGYDFDGWYYGETKVLDNNSNLVNNVSNFTDGSGNWTHSSNVTLKAKWTPKNYTITLDSNEGNYGLNSTTFTFGSNTTNLANIPTKVGYEFDGWYDSTLTTKIVDANNSFVNNVTNYTDASGNWNRDESITLKAKWNVKKYTINFVINDDIVNIHNTYQEEFDIFSAFTMPTYTDKNDVNGLYSVKLWQYGDITYYGNQSVNFGVSMIQNADTFTFYGVVGGFYNLDYSVVGITDSSLQNATLEYFLDYNRYSGSASTYQELLQAYIRKGLYLISPSLVSENDSRANKVLLFDDTYGYLLDNDIMNIAYSFDATTGVPTKSVSCASATLLGIANISGNKYLYKSLIDNNVYAIDNGVVYNHQGLTIDKNKQLYYFTDSYYGYTNGSYEIDDETSPLPSGEYDFNTNGGIDSVVSVSSETGLSRNESTGVISYNGMDIVDSIVIIQNDYLVQYKALEANLLVIKVNDNFYVIDSDDKYKDQLYYIGNNTLQYYYYDSSEQKLKIATLSNSDVKKYNGYYYITSDGIITSPWGGD